MQLRSAGYQVCFEDQQFSYLNSFLAQRKFSNVSILCDTNTRRHCVPRLQAAVKALGKATVLAIRAGEAHKNLASLQQAWNFLLAQGADRHSLLICVGGGVLCDLGGFAASTFKRGMAFIHVPTTLLAMADASVGGKTGIDFEGYKNLIGSITQPEGVFIQQAFLKTLPARDILNGMAEIAKAALIGDKRLWRQLLAAPDPGKAEIAPLIKASVKVKNRIVIRDPHERNVRKLLNFGHTAGHAIESHFLKKRNALLHGEAIAIGICVELCLGKQLRYTQPATTMEAFFFFRKHYALPPFSTREVSSFLSLMRHDKKNRGGHFNFSLVEKPGVAAIDITATEEQVRAAFMLYNNLLKTGARGR